MRIKELIALIAVLALPGLAMAQAAPGQWVKDFRGADFGDGSLCGSTINPGVTCFLAFGSATYSPTSGLSDPFFVKQKAILCLNRDMAVENGAGGLVAELRAGVDVGTAQGSEAMPNSGLPFTDAGGATTYCYELLPGVFLVRYTIGVGGQSASLSIRGF